MNGRQVTTAQHFLAFCRGVSVWAEKNQRLVSWTAKILLLAFGLGGGGFAVSKYKDAQQPPVSAVVVFPDSTFQMLNQILTASKDVRAEVANFKTETNARLVGLEYGQSRFARIVAKSEVLRRAEKQVQEDEETEKRFHPHGSITVEVPAVAGPNWRAPGTWGAW